MISRLKASNINLYNIITRSSSTCSARFPPTLDHLQQATKIKHLHFKDLTDYNDASVIQSNIVDRHLSYKIGLKNSRAISNLYPTLLTFEFDSVYTGGKREKDSKKATSMAVDSNGITTNGIPYVHTDRGGQVTYHGPGQLVAYFIWDLRLWKNLSSRCFVNFIEQCSMSTIEKAGNLKVCTTSNTGVWVTKEAGEKKISSIGLNLKRNVTSHGLSINLKPNLVYLNDPSFVMCGLEGYQQTSIANELGSTDLNVESLADMLSQSVQERMNNYMMNTGTSHLYNLKIDKITYDHSNLFSIDDIEFKPNN